MSDLATRIAAVPLLAAVWDEDRCASQIPAAEKGPVNRALEEGADGNQRFLRTQLIQRFVVGWFFVGRIFERDRPRPSWVLDGSPPVVRRDQVAIGEPHHLGWIA